MERFIRNYPRMRERKNAIQSQSMTANYSAMPRGGGGSRSTENVALRQLAPGEEYILRAIERAIEDVGRMDNGREVLTVVEYVYWMRFTMAEAAEFSHLSERTAQRRADKFVYAVAKNLYFL